MLDLLTDDALIDELRSGKRDAALVLWRRHVCDCRAIVNSLIDDPGMADQALRKAFAQVIEDLSANDRPLMTFRLYLQISTTVGAALCLRTRDPLVRAFAKIARRDQLAIWASAISEVPRIELALLLSSSPESAVEYVREALGRLRRVWRTEALSNAQPGSTCIWVINATTFARAGFIKQVSTRRYLQHLEECQTCKDDATAEARFPFTLANALFHTE